MTKMTKAKTAHVGNTDTKGKLWLAPRTVAAMALSALTSRGKLVAASLSLLERC